MYSCLRLSALSLLALNLAAQTNNVAQRLGYPVDAKLLILHPDAHPVDTASFDSLNSGAVSSASIMVPCPWLTEVAEYAKFHPDADLGLHLTLTSEWKTYRWDSLAPNDKVPSLLRSDGTFTPRPKKLRRTPIPPRLELNPRAQVERRLVVGIHPTHLDGHMGSLFSKPETDRRLHQGRARFSASLPRTDAP